MDWGRNPGLGFEQADCCATSLGLREAIENATMQRDPNL